MTDTPEDLVEKMTEREKIISILTALRLPRGQYIVAGSGAMVLHEVPRTRPIGDLDIFVSTALWFQLYENANGFIWGLFVPDSRDVKRKADPPYLFANFLGIEVNVFFDWRKRETGNFNVAEALERRIFTKDHWPTLDLPTVLRLKQESHRDKDLDDIAVLEEVLG